MKDMFYDILDDAYASVVSEQLHKLKSKSIIKHLNYGELGQQLISDILNKSLFPVEK